MGTLHSRAGTPGSSCLSFVPSKSRSQLLRDEVCTCWGHWGSWGLPGGASPWVGHFAVPVWLVIRSAVQMCASDVGAGSAHLSAQLHLSSGGAAAVSPQAPPEGPSQWSDRRCPAPAVPGRQRQLPLENRSFLHLLVLCWQLICCCTAFKRKCKNFLKVRKWKKKA